MQPINLWNESNSENNHQKTLVIQLCSQFPYELKYKMAI